MRRVSLAVAVAIAGCCVFAALASGQVSGSLFAFSPGGGLNAAASGGSDRVPVLPVAESSSVSGWSAPIKIDNTPGRGASGLVGVSCVSASLCVAIDGSGHVLTWNGSSWSAPDEVDNNKGDNDSAGRAGISCVSPSFCASSDGPGQNVLTWNGSSWSAPEDPDNGGGVYVSSSSCASASFCVAIDSSGRALTWNGSSWSAPVKLSEHGVGPSNEGVSCVSASFCVAIDGSESGDVLTWNGSSWSAPDDIDGMNTLTAVSCASVSFCFAIDDDGNAITYSTLLAAPGPARVSTTYASAHATCTDRTACTITFVLEAKATNRTVVVGQKTITLDAGQSETAKVKLNSTGQRLLKSRHTLHAKLIASSGGSVLSSQPVTFQQPKK